MASRTWNQVDACIWDEDWSELAILVAIQIITHCPNQYGIYDMPLGAIKRFWRGIGQSPESIAAAIQELTSDGFIRLFGDGKVWIVKKFKRELAHLLNDNYRKGVASFISDYPEIEPDFARLYGEYYAVRPKLDIIPMEASIKLVSNQLETPLVTSESESESDSNFVTTRTKKESKTPVTPPNKLRAPTERERQLFPLVEVLGKIINEGRAERRLAPVTQNEAKAAIVLRQCYDKHGLQPKQLIALAQWMFSADNRDLDFNTGNLSYLHNWRKPWTNGVAVICKYEEFLKWLQKQAV